MIKEENVSLKSRSYMKIGGTAKEVIHFETVEELAEFSKINNKRPFILGNCSNILFSDSYINMTFGTLDGIKEVKEISPFVYEFGAGLKFKEVVAFMKKNNFSGLENIAGIPGTVGGLANINGGAYKKEIFENIEEIEYLDENFEIKRVKKENIKFGYRNTEFKERKDIITRVVLRFEIGFKWTEMTALLQSRKEKQPLEYPNLGSIFKNPQGDFAARLIEESGLKGKKIGGAQISEKHANFIVNIDNASFDDVINLVKEAKESVFEKFGINLQEEIIIVK